MLGSQLNTIMKFFLIAREFNEHLTYHYLLKNDVFWCVLYVLYYVS
jgi:hypothetical protein